MSGLTKDREIFCSSFFKAETPGWELAPWSSHGVMLYCLKIWHMVPPQPETEKEKARLELSLGSWKRVWCGPSFTLHWEKPGSVAPLRLVGCLIRTPALPGTYFYSFFSLYFFCRDLSWPLFRLFSSNFSLFLAICVNIFLLCLKEDWEKLLYAWFLWDMTCCLLPFLSLLAVFL